MAAGIIFDMYAGAQYARLGRPNSAWRRHRPAAKASSREQPAGRCAALAGPYVAMRQRHSQASLTYAPPVISRHRARRHLNAARLDVYVASAPANNFDICIKHHA